jgi:hypothetical protein
MSPEERKLLGDLADKVAKIPPPARDPEAEEFIRTRIGNRPDALYLLTQTVVVQGMAIEHAQQEIDQLKQKLAQVQQIPQPAQPQMPPPMGNTGFPPQRGSGWQTPQAPPPPAFNPGFSPAPPPPGYGYPPAPGFGPPPPPPPSGPFGGLGGLTSGGMGGFLKTAGYTAAGVAAGALAFEGVKSIFGGVEHMMGFGNEPHHGGGGGGFFNDPPVHETVINNYYDSPQDAPPSYERGAFADNLGPDPSIQYDSTDLAPADSLVDDSSNNDDQV